jgi:hypothetical protein
MVGQARTAADWRLDQQNNWLLAHAIFHDGFRDNRHVQPANERSDERYLNVRETRPLTQ